MQGSKIGGDRQMTLSSYPIEWSEQRVPLTGELTPAWERATPAELASFNWYKSGSKPVTTVRALYDDSSIYFQFDVEDKYISSSVTELNGPTYEDSCVEFFTTPGTDPTDPYLNFEANCCGFFKLAWQEPGWQERDIGRDLINDELAADISIETSINNDTKTPAPSDGGWWLAAEIPFDILSSFTGRHISPTKGTHWRGNFHRTGVQTPSQKASWNPIETEEPAFHTPEHFGRLVFK